MIHYGSIMIQTFNYGNKQDINVFTRYQGDYSLT